MWCSCAVFCCILTELSNWLDEHEYTSVQQMQGSLSYRNAADPGAYERENYLSVLDSFTPPPGVRY
jgi:dihydroorotate dehydrogenase (fumarate)